MGVQGVILAQGAHEADKIVSLVQPPSLRRSKAVGCSQRLRHLQLEETEDAYLVQWKPTWVSFQALESSGLTVRRQGADRVVSHRRPPTLAHAATESERKEHNRPGKSSQRVGAGKARCKAGTGQVGTDKAASNKGRAQEGGGGRGRRDEVDARELRPTLAIA